MRKVEKWVAPDPKEAMAIHQDKKSASDRDISMLSASVRETPKAGSRTGKGHIFDNDDEYDSEEGLERFDSDVHSEDSDEDDDEGDGSSWLKSLSVSATEDGAEVGTCSGFIITRKTIRHDFYSEMDDPTKTTSQLAFGIFDRWGNLKPQYIHHNFKKGTGVWGKELNHGRILWIEQIDVHPDYRRQGLGRKMAIDM